MKRSVWNYRMTFAIGRWMESCAWPTSWPTTAAWKRPGLRQPRLWLRLRPLITRPRSIWPASWRACTTSWLRSSVSGAHKVSVPADLNSFVQDKSASCGNGVVCGIVIWQSCVRAPPVVRFSCWRLQLWPTSPSSTAWPARSCCSSTPFRSCYRPAETARGSTPPTPKTRYGVEIIFSHFLDIYLFIFGKMFGQVVTILANLSVLEQCASEVMQEQGSIFVMLLLFMSSSDKK